MDSTLTAALFFACAIILDACLANPPTDVRDAPSSLRASSIISTLVLAAPLVKNKEYNASLQRPIALLVLLLLSFLGNHEGTAELRCFDAIFIIIVLMAAVFLVCIGGVDSKSKQRKPGMDPVVACRLLAGSLLVYSSLRSLRASLLHATAVRGFDVSSEKQTNATIFETSGYGYADETVTLFGTISSISQLVAGAMIMLSDGMVATEPLILSSAISIIASFVLLLALGSQADELTGIFSDGACTAASCDAANQARRFALTNNPASALFVNALGTLVLSTVPSARHPEKRQADGVLMRWFFGIAFFAAWILLAVSYMDFETGDGVFIEYVLVIGLAALFIARRVDVFVGNLLTALLCGFTIYELDTYHANAIDTLSSICFFVFFGLLSLHTLIQVVLWMRNMRVVSDLIVDALLGLTMTMALAACVAIACYSGGPVAAMPFRQNRRNAMLFIFVHFFPLFTTLNPANKVLSYRLDLKKRVTAWLSLAVLVSIVHTTANWHRFAEQVRAVEEWTVVPASLGAAAPLLSILLV